MSTSRTGSDHVTSALAPVAYCAELAPGCLGALVHRFDLRLVEVAAGQPIPGSHWGEPEAGLVATALMVRADTPVHSALHEACHFVCMDRARRAHLHTDAAGGYDEENAVCYLSILLADHIAGFGRDRMLADMDAWGYSFRLGSARAWFETDAEDALAWLGEHRLVEHGAPTFRVRS